VDVADPAGRSSAERAYNAFLERLVLPAGDRALRTEFMATLRTWRQVQHLPRPELDRLQRQNLTALLEHATTRVPYYRDLGIDRPADPDEWLRRFPILTKATLREQGDRLCTTGAEGLVEVSSSGSSGFQSTVWVSPAEISRTQAIQTLWWEWAGYRLGDRLLQTGMTPERGVVKALKDRLLRTTYVVAFGLDDREMADILRAGRKKPWRALGGYASNIDAFARAAAAEGIDDVSFTTIISWGDKLFAEYRDRLESQFSAPVFDLYGTTEGVCIASQREGSDYYVMTPHVVLELLDDAWQPVAPGEMGRVVVTRLDATSMPLVRFYLGDLAMARPDGPPPPGGLAFPQLERIVGRDTDTIRTPGGRTLTVHTFTGVFEHVPEILQFAVVPGDGGFTVEYRPAPSFEPSVLARVATSLSDAVGERLAIRWEAVDRIAPSPSGKPQIIRPAPKQPGDGGSGA
jgi:phenylacetate-CoA ligase